MVSGRKSRTSSIRRLFVVYSSSIRRLFIVTGLPVIEIDRCSALRCYYCGLSLRCYYCGLSGVITAVVVDVICLVLEVNLVENLILKSIT